MSIERGAEQAIVTTIYIICTANTWGNGSGALLVTVMDSATLDRFVVLSSIWDKIDELPTLLWDLPTRSRLPESIQYRDMTQPVDTGGSGLPITSRVVSTIQDVCSTVRVRAYAQGAKLIRQQNLF